MILAHKPPVTFFNPLIANNLAQMSAVGAIVKAPTGSLPFIVFGPYVASFSCVSAHTFSQAGNWKDHDDR
jgi:hypothetical protein